MCKRKIVLLKAFTYMSCKIGLLDSIRISITQHYISESELVLYCLFIYFSIPIIFSTTNWIVYMQFLTASYILFVVHIESEDIFQVVICTAFIVRDTLYETEIRTTVRFAWYTLQGAFLWKDFTTMVRYFSE